MTTQNYGRGNFKFDPMHILEMLNMSRSKLVEPTSVTFNDNIKVPWAQQEEKQSEQRTSSNISLIRRDA